MKRLLLSIFLALVSFPVFAAMNIGIDALVSGVITLIVVGAICWLLWWLVGYVGVPEPFNKFARVFIAVVAVLFLIGWLLGLLGHPVVNIR